MPNGRDLIVLTWLAAIDHVVVITVLLLNLQLDIEISLNRCRFHCPVIHKLYTLLNLFLAQELCEWTIIAQLVVLELEHLPLTHVICAQVQLLLLVFSTDGLDTARLGSNLSAANPIVIAHIVGSMSIRAERFDP